MEKEYIPVADGDLYLVNNEPPLHRDRRAISPEEDQALEDEEELDNFLRPKIFTRLERDVGFLNEQPVVEGSGDVPTTVSPVRTTVTYTETVTSDDEDLEGSGGSGDGGDVTPTPDYSRNGPVAYYRVFVTLADVRFTPELLDRESELFNQLTDQLIVDVEYLYSSIPGQQFATVLQYE